MSTQRPRVAVFSLGGTIASLPAVAGLTPQLDAADLLDSVPSVRELAEIEAVALRQVASCELTLSDCIVLARRINAAFDTGCSGVVVTQGTDTIEETSFALDLLLDGSKPVVVTGAMRDPSTPGADGPANLAAALRVAVSELAAGLGCVVVMNDEIHAARFVRKTHTANPGAFASSGVGILGWVVEGRPNIVVRPVRMGFRLLERAAVSTAPGAEAIPRVALVKVGLGDDGRLIEPLESLGYTGLVVEAMGGGHVPGALVSSLERLARRMPVVLASRTGAGEVLRATYSYPGSEVALLAHGLIRAGHLDGLKARILLSLLLAVGADSAEIAGAFAFFSG